MDPLTATFLFVAAVLIVTFIFAPIPSQPTMQPAGLDEFQIPDNSTYKVVPRVYGTAYLKGNCIYYGNLNTTRIMSDGGGGKK